MAVSGSRGRGVLMSEISWVSVAFARTALLGKDDITAIVVQIGSRWDGRVGTWDN